MTIISSIVTIVSNMLKKKKSNGPLNLSKNAILYNDEISTRVSSLEGHQKL